MKVESNIFCVFSVFLRVSMCFYFIFSFLIPLSISSVFQPPSSILSRGLRFFSAALSRGVWFSHSLLHFFSFLPYSH